MRTKPPFPGWVLINGTWADPDSDYARTYGYDRKTKTVNVKRGVEYLENSKPEADTPLARKIRKEVDEVIREVKRYDPATDETAVKYVPLPSYAGSARPKSLVELSNRRRGGVTLEDTLAYRKRSVVKKPSRLLTTRKCARGSRGMRTIGRRRVTVCCPPGMYRPRAKRKCKVVRRRLVR